MVCRLFGAKPLYKPTLGYWQLDGPMGTNFSENLVKIQKFQFMKMHFKISSAKWRPFIHELILYLHAGEDWLVSWVVLCAEGIIKWPDELLEDSQITGHADLVQGYGDVIEEGKSSSLYMV